ncbi:MAG: hypothetical protein COU32_04395 [Candidatus Magasanikbacteria bacterium CG10_big_fil_rev_8_21_14_0_10_42_10]|uniref:O-antigen ligase-related domain-containing protein n=2 Tax=Candidatus Magasanikiibacteriota TaxID=1752731 RepID=A0A2H0TV13_9BACT|nr:MAG: hypothetical protein COU32_04395 [Candidatus Magasanikbacteria bacterium CG10_big_fil_rev_8_21_14_0_10_42_10]PIZ93514.1 MAG: hypothetical protein COX82_02490 [Candidatus Magasanikbacteria bacterium CG_4_10_14_0_2_um_filter_41_10]
MNNMNVEKILRHTTYFFLFLLPWQTVLILQERFLEGAKWEYGTIGFFATEILGWVLVLLFMMWYIKKFQNSKFKIQNFRWSKDRLFVLSIFLFTSYGVLMAFFAGDSDVAFQHAQWVMLGSLLFLLFFIGPIKAKSALWALVLGSIPVSLLGIWQFLMQSTVASTLLGLSQHIVYESGTSIIQSSEIGRWFRAYGSFSHPNVFGGYLVCAMVSTLLLSLSVQRWKRVGLQSIVVLQSAALFFTFSRSAWIAVGIVLLFYCSIVVRHATFGRGLKLGWRTREVPPLALPLAKGEKRASLITFCVSVVSVFVIFSFVYSPLLQTRFAVSSSNEVASITERVSGYSEAFHIFQNNWLIGVGGGNYTYALMQAMPGHDVWWYQPVHNVGVLFIVEYGVFGMVLLVLVILNFIRNLKLDIRNLWGYIAILISLLLLDHYLWSSFVGVILLFVFTALYFRYIRDTVSPHVVPT